MSIATIGKLKGHITIEQVLQFVRDTYDKDARIFFRDTTDWDESPAIKERYDDSGRWIGNTCSIAFNLPDDGERMLFYCYENVNFYENLEYYQEHGLGDMVKAETTYISLGCWGHSVDIMKAIVSNFGGWLDENDCDDVVFYEIEKVGC